MNQWPEIAKLLGFGDDEATTAQLKLAHKIYVVPFESYLKLQPAKEEPQHSMMSMKSMKSTRQMTRTEQRVKSEPMDVDPSTSVILDEDVDIIGVDLNSSGAPASSLSEGKSGTKSIFKTTRPALFLCLLPFFFLFIFILFGIFRSKCGVFLLLLFLSPFWTGLTCGIHSFLATPQACQLCHHARDEDKLLLCDSCDRGFHMYCLKPALTHVPRGDWFCPECLGKQEEYGFDEGKLHTLASFKQMADSFKKKWFSQVRPISTSQCVP